MGKWDSNMKGWFYEAPEDIVPWVIKGAKFVRLVSPVLEGKEIYCDVLCEIRVKGKRAYLHLEFQKRRDSQMARRLWEYNDPTTKSPKKRAS